MGAMAKSVPKPYRRAGVVAPAPLPWAGRWYGKVILVLLAVTLLSLAFAPFKQFYLAWVGLVPWLVMLRHCRSPGRAFAWSWVAGVAFFAANLWWIACVTIPGMVALMAFLGLYWAA